MKTKMHLAGHHSSVILLIGSSYVGVSECVGFNVSLDT